MKNYKLWKFDVLSGASIESDNSGQNPQQAKYRKHFINLDTAVVSSITDLDSKKYKRNKNIANFTTIYRAQFKKQIVSVLSFVVNESKYPTVSQFINMLGKKLSRKAVEKLGYVWVRDVGEINFERHFHILIATTRITAKMFQELFSKKNHSYFDVEFMRNPNGLKAYMTRKELFGVKKQRSYGKSKEFKIVNLNELNTQ